MKKLVLALGLCLAAFLSVAAASFASQDAATLTAEINLTVSDLVVVTTIDTIALTQDHDLVVADLTVATTIDTVTLVIPGVNVFDLCIEFGVPTFVSRAAGPVQFVHLVDHGVGDHGQLA